MAQPYRWGLMIATALALPSPAFCQDKPTSAEIEKQIIALQKELVARKAEEAKAAIAAAKKMTDKACADLASIGKAAEMSDCAASPASAASTVAGGAVAASGNQAPEADRPADPKDPPAGKQKFGGIEFGVGVAFTSDLGKRDRIKEAMIDPNGIVRVTSLENKRGRIVLESHYLFTPIGDFLGLKGLGLENTRTFKDGVDVGRKSWGFGPFLALQPGSDNVIDALGFGIMLGLKRPGSQSESFNVGIGVMYDLNTKLLGDGFVANQPAPANEKDIRFQTTSQSGFLIMTSYSF